MKLFHLLSIITCTLVIYARLAHAQQSYIGDPEQACKSMYTQAIYYGYTGNGPMSCDATLTFRSQYPYNSLISIASLFKVDRNELAKANPKYTVDVDWNKIVYVPVTCERSDRTEYRNLISYAVGVGESIFYIANNTFEGLTTCQAIKAANGNDVSITAGSEIYIRLRCACPTINQQKAGIVSLTTYVVGTGDTISNISTLLNVDSKSIQEANLLSEDSVIYRFSTLLIPVMNSTSERKSSPLSKGAIAGIAASGCAALLALGGAAIKFNLCGSLCSCFNSTKNYFAANFEPKKTAEDVSTGTTTTTKSNREDTVTQAQLELDRASIVKLDVHSK